jgi:hypothetical protein
MPMKFEENMILVILKTSHISCASREMVGRSYTYIMAKQLRMALFSSFATTMRELSLLK